MELNDEQIGALSEFKALMVEAVANPEGAKDAVGRSFAVEKRWSEAGGCWTDLVRAVHLLKHPQYEDTASDEVKELAALPEVQDMAEAVTKAAQEVILRVEWP